MMQEEIVKETNMDEMVEEGNVKKKKKRGSCLLTFLIVLVCLFLFIIVPFLPHRKTEFSFVEEFDEYGGIVLIDIPENATDIKYYCNDMFFALESAYSFIIDDEKDFDAYMEANEFEIHDDRTVREYMTNRPEYADDVFKIRDWYDYVVEDDIKDYHVLYFYSFDASYEAILVDEETGRFVAIKYVTL